MLLEKGERGLLVGQTGSGKTQNALFQLRESRVWPIIIFDTKIEDAFLDLPVKGDSIDMVESFAEFEKHSKLRRNERPDYLIVRPSIAEAQSPELMDEYTQLAYNKFGSGLFYYDEIYNWHNNGQAGPGLIGLLTRGRSKGKTVLMATQRPSWISRFCITESQKFYIHWLADQRDKKTLAAVIPNFDKLGELPPFHFWHYSTKEHRNAPRIFKPVPMAEEIPDEEKVRPGWL